MAESTDPQRRLMEIESALVDAHQDYQAAGAAIDPSGDHEALRNELRAKHQNTIDDLAKQRASVLEEIADVEKSDAADGGE